MVRGCEQDQKSASLNPISDCHPRHRLEGRSWKECRRGLHAQAGLGGLVSLYVLIKLVSGVAPKKYVDRHTVKLKKVVTLELSLEEIVQVLGLSIAGGSGLFLLGNYGVEGDFSSVEEEWYFGAVMIAGGVSLLVTAVWKGLVICAEIKHDQEAARADGGEVEETSAGAAVAAAAKEDDTFVTEVSSIWVGLSVLVTTVFSGLSIAFTFTGNRLCFILKTNVLPIAIGFNALSVFAQPRRADRSTVMFLRLQLFSFAILGEVLAVFSKWDNEGTETLSNLGLTLIEIVVFHFGLRLRASIGRLPDKDLNKFLTETLFKGGLKTVASLLFILFRSLKCMIENSLDQCSTNSSCATFICIYLLLQWMLKTIHGSIEQEWQKEISLSTEKIAKMNLGWRRAAEGIMLALMAGCGAFLFALMSARAPDRELVRKVGFTGVVAGVACGISEIVTVTKEQERRRTGSLFERSGAASAEELVDCCSWWFVALSLLITTFFMVLMVIYAITMEEWAWNLGGEHHGRLTSPASGKPHFLLVAHTGMTVPIASICLTMAVFSRPKDEEAGIKILQLQYFGFAFGALGAGSIGLFRDGRHTFGCIVGVAVFFMCIALIFNLKLRRKAAQLPPPELSKFLCNTVLLGGVGAMAPMIFFSFETLSCFASNGLESDQCNNTSSAALWLSIYLFIITSLSFLSKAVSREERSEGLTYKNLAILRLETKGKIQGVFGVITALASMYLFSVLGVEGNPNDTNFVVGAAGMMTLMVSVLIEMLALAMERSMQADQPVGATSETPRRSLSGRTFLSERRLSLGNVSREMTVAGLV